MATYQFQINGRNSTVTIDDPQTPLLNVLQENFQINGARFGCGLGQCGACTVLLDGRPIRACNTPVSRADGGSIVSMEGLRAHDGLANPDALHPIQQAFVTEQALQCGFCGAGPIMYGYALVRDNPKPSRADIEQGLKGIICRCCAHTRMIDAVQRYAQEKTA